MALKLLYEKVLDMSNYKNKLSDEDISLVWQIGDALRGSYGLPYDIPPGVTKFFADIGKPSLGKKYKDTPNKIEQWLENGLLNSKQIDTLWHVIYDQEMEMDKKGELQ